MGSKLCCEESPFEVRAGGGLWKRAEYQLQAESVRLTLPSDVDTPFAARYAWEAWPQCALYNGVGGPDDHSGIAGTPWCWEGDAPCAF